MREGGLRKGSRREGKEGFREGRAWGEGGRETRGPYTIISARHGYAQKHVRQWLLAVTLHLHVVGRD